jgi:hypothetical protein
VNIRNFGNEGKHDNQKVNGNCSSHGGLGIKVTVIYGNFGNKGNHDNVFVFLNILLPCISLQILGN